MQVKERKFELDLIRVIACLMVITMHAPMPLASGAETTGTNLFLLAISYLCAPCIGLFFMVSGALLLPVREEIKPFLGRRLGKVVFPTLFATALYLSVKLLAGKLGAGDLWHHLVSVPFSAQGTGILWFMYTLVGVYLFAPLMSRALFTPPLPGLTGFKYCLCLWGITLCYPLIALFADVNETNTGILYYFSGYAGYFILGYALTHIPALFRWRYLLPAVFVALLAPVACKLLRIEVDFYRMFWYLSVFVVILCIAIYKAALQWGACLWRHCQLLKQFVVLFSNLSFGIYLLHFLVVRDILWNLSWIRSISSFYLQTGAVVLLGLVITWVSCYLVSLLPFSQYLIGYHHTWRKK